MRLEEIEEPAAGESRVKREGKGKAVRPYNSVKSSEPGEQSSVGAVAIGTGGTEVGGEDDTHGE